MGESCCQAKAEDLKALAKRQAKVLWIVLIINLVMFFVEFSSGLRFESLALTGDSLDMLGDALAYGSSLVVIGLSLRAKAWSAVLKAGLMASFGLFVAGRAVFQTFFEVSPQALGMGAVGFLALAANLVCLALLTRHKQDDINFRSVWLCSRNDIIANTSVLVAAGLVFLTSTKWPDLIVGIGIAVLFLKSAYSVVKEATLVLAENRAPLRQSE